MLATLWLLGVACWEIAGPFGAGHYAAGPSFAVAAENSLRFKQPGPVPNWLLSRPALPSEIYCHHPWGFYWLMTLFVGVLGQHDWVVRLPAVLLSAGSVPLLYGLGRALWGPVSGAVAAVAFVTLPISLSFCNLSNLEVPSIFGMLLLSWASLRFFQTERRGYAWTALGAALFACAMDWPGALFVVFWCGALGTSALAARYFRVDQRGPLWRLGLGLALTALLTLGVQLAWFARLGQLPELWRSAELRSTGRELPLAEVLASRRYWLELSFTWPAILLGKLAALVLVVRVLWLRRWQEACVLCVLGAALVHYLVFKNGADVHVFWSHYFAPFYALGLGALVATLRALCQRLGQRPGLRWLVARPWLGLELVPLALGLVPAALIVRDAVVALVYARLTGGRFDQHGLLIHADKDKLAFMRWLGARMPSGSGARLDASMKPSLWMSWTLQHPLRQGPPPFFSQRAEDRYFLLDARFADEDLLQRLTQTFGANVAGPFWAFDRLSKPGAMHGFAVRRRAPNGLERYFVSGTHDLYWVEPGALQDWELRDHFGAASELPAAIEARDLDDVRLLHNLAVARGDAAGAAALLERLLRTADRSVAVSYDDGTQLIGVTRERLAFRVWFRAAGPAAAPRRFRVFSRVSQRLPWSLVPRDAQLREVGLESPVPETRWKRGYVYCLAFDLLERPGREDLVASFWGDGAPHARGRFEPIVLARAQ